MLPQVFEVLSFGFDTGPQSFCHSFTVYCLSIIRCSNARSSQKFGVWVCQLFICGNQAAGSKPIFKKITVVN